MDRRCWLVIAGGSCGADLGNALGEGVVSEVWDAKQPLGRPKQVGGEDLELDLGRQRYGSERFLRIGRVVSNIVGAAAKPRTTTSHSGISG